MSNRRFRWALTLAVLATFAFMVARGAHAQETYVYTPADTLAAIDEAAAESGVSRAYLLKIINCETGHTLDPYSIGRADERGAAQLHPRGELPRFYAYGFDNPFSPYQAVSFLAQRINEGGARAWTCA